MIVCKGFMSVFERLWSFFIFLLLKKVISLIVYNDEGWKILHFSHINGFHSELGILEQFNPGNTVAPENRGGAAYRAEIENRRAYGMIQRLNLHDYPSRA